MKGKMKGKIIFTIYFLAIVMICSSIERDSNSTEKSKFYTLWVNQGLNYSIYNNFKSEEENYSAKSLTADIKVDFKRNVYKKFNKSKLNFHCGYLYESKHIDDYVAVDFEEKDDNNSKIEDDIGLSQYYVNLNYERYKFNDNDSINNSLYIGLFANLKDGKNRFSKDLYQRFDVNLNLKNGTIIFGKVFGRINKYYEIYWNNKFEEILNNPNNSETVLGFRLDYKSVSIAYKDIYNSKYSWRMKYYDKFSMGLKGNFEKYLQFSQKIQSRINLELIGGLSFCEKWEDRVGMDLQFKLDYQLFRKIFGKKLNYNLQAIFESIKFSKEMPYRVITTQNINMKFVISKHFSILPKVSFKANWYKESHSGMFYISTYDDFSYSSNSSSLFMSEFSLNILYQF